MFGNIINNLHIKKMVQEKTITISPFRQERLKLAHYALRPAAVLSVGKINEKNSREIKLKCSFENGTPCEFSPGEYAIVEVEEFISLADGIVGQFLISSNLIENGFLLSAGKLDPGYGTLQGKRQKLRFGVTNMLSTKNFLSPNDGFAHIYFLDLRGLNNLPAIFTDPEIDDLIKRVTMLKRARDDGPTYD